MIGQWEQIRSRENNRPEIASKCHTKPEPCRRKMKSMVWMDGLIDQIAKTSNDSPQEIRNSQDGTDETKLFFLRWSWSLSLPNDPSTLNSNHRGAVKAVESGSKYIMIRGRIIMLRRAWFTGSSCIIPVEWAFQQAHDPEHISMWAVSWFQTTVARSVPRTQAHRKQVRWFYKMLFMR